MVGWLLEFSILATSNVLSGWVLTYDSATHDDRYSFLPLGNQTTGTIMTRFPTQSHYPEVELTIPCPMVLRPGARLGSDKYQFYKSLLARTHNRPNALAVSEGARL